MIDGFTDPSGTTFDGVSGGRFASRAIAAVVRALPRAVTAEEAVRAMSAALSGARPRVRPGPGGPGFGRPCAVATLYSDERREVWRVGDAPFMVGSDLHARTTAVNRAAADFRRALVSALLTAGADADELRSSQAGFSALRPLLDVQAALGNRVDSPFGYPVLDGSRVPRDFIEVHAVEDDRDVVLATDGYPELLPTLLASEERLAEMLRADPLGIDELADVGKEWDPANCSYDDRAYVRLRT